MHGRQKPNRKTTVPLDVIQTQKATADIPKGQATVDELSRLLYISILFQVLLIRFKRKILI